MTSISSLQIAVAIAVLTSAAAARAQPITANGINRVDVTKADTVSVTGTSLVFASTPASPKSVLPEEELDKAAFPLLRRGLLVGAGVGVHAVGFDLQQDRTILKGSDIVGIAYLGWFPAYRKDHLYAETNAYCASFEGRHARARAEEIAIARTREMVKPGDPRPLDQQVREERGWELEAPANCYSRRIGVFVALTGDFKADVDPPGTPVVQTKEISPLVTTGLVFSMKAYVNVLVGVTISNVTLKDKTADAMLDGHSNRMFSFFFGIGTPIDALGGLFK